MIMYKLKYKKYAPKKINSQERNRMVSDVMKSSCPEQQQQQQQQAEVVVSQSISRTCYRNYVATQVKKLTMLLGARGQILQLSQ